MAHCRPRPPSPARAPLAESAQKVMIFNGRISEKKALPSSFAVPFVPFTTSFRLFTASIRWDATAPAPRQEYVRQIMLTPLWKKTLATESGLYCTAHPVICIRARSPIPTRIGIRTAGRNPISSIRLYPPYAAVNYHKRIRGPMSFRLMNTNMHCYLERDNQPI